MLPDTPIGIFVTLLIVGLFFGGLIRTGLLFRAIRTEQDVLKKVKKGLEGIQKPDSIDSLEDLWKRANIWEGNVAQTAIGKRIKELWHIRGRTGAEAVSAIYETRQDMTLELPRYLTSILVLLGLAGTISGLGDTLQHLNTSLSGKIADAGSLLNILKPMRSAFSCTLFGIITSVILAYFLNLFGRYQSKFIADMEEVVTLEVMPLIFPDTEAARLQKMGDILERSQNFLQDFARTIQDSRNFFAETLGDAVRGAAKELEHTLTAATQALEGSLGRMQSAATSLSQSADSIVQYRAELESERAQILGYLKENAQQLIRLSSSVLDPLKVAAEALSASQAGIEAIAVGNTAEREALYTRIGSVVESVNGMTKALGNEQIALTDITGRMQISLEHSAKDFSQRLGENSIESQRVTEAFASLLRQIHPEVMNLPNGDLLGDSLSQLTTRLQAVFNKLDRVSTQFDKLSEAIPQTVNQQTTTFTEQSSLNARHIQALTTAVTTLVSQNNAQQQNNSQQLSLLLDSVQKSLAMNNNFMQANLLELRQLRSHMQEPLWRQVWGSRDPKNGSGSNSV